MSEHKHSEEKDSQYEALQSSNFKQQKLSAWRPVPTITSTTITFITFGLLFITIGIIITLFSNQIQEISVDYSNCETKEEEIINNKNNNKYKIKRCSIKLDIKNKMVQPVMVYYQLDNFYQNHRRYVKSKSNEQLAGNVLSVDDLLFDCDPIVKNSDLIPGTLSLSGKNITKESPDEAAYPCGLIAKSFFNDRYRFKNDDIKINESNIAWASDKELKYKLPDRKDYKDIMWIDTTDEHFMVWMRPAGLPNFRKLWGRIEKDIEPGSYEVEIDYNYDIDFGGKKHFVLSTVNAFGGKNSFLGISYIVVGGVCLVLALLFFIGYKSHSKTA